jgi:hypothetical protein
MLDANGTCVSNNLACLSSGSSSSSFSPTHLT